MQYLQSNLRLAVLLQLLNHTHMRVPSVSRMWGFDILLHLSKIIFFIVAHDKMRETSGFLCAIHLSQSNVNTLAL